MRWVLHFDYATIVVDGWLIIIDLIIQLLLQEKVSYRRIVEVLYLEVIYEEYFIWVHL